MSISIKQLEKEVFVREKTRKQTSKNTNWLSKDLSIRKKLNAKKKQAFYGELGMLLKAGIDIKTALEINVEEQVKEKDKNLMTTIQACVIGGMSLSEAIRSSEQFSDYEYFSLKIGEESAKVDEVLINLSEYYAKRTEQKRKLISMFSYPMLVLTMAILAIYFMLNFIVPMFEDVFKRFDGDLPKLTKIIIALSEWSSANAIYVILFLGSIITLLYMQRKKVWFRKISSTLIMKTPFLGELTKKIYMARFCHSMHFLIASKNPLLKSLELVRNMIGFYPYENAIQEIEVEILKGKSLHECLANYKFISRKMVYLVKVGEEVNQLELIFDKLNDQYEEEVSFQMNTLGNMMEPILILFIGSFVAIILISMYLPLFQLSTSVF